MKKNILWTGIEYYSLENCLVNTGVEGTEINSTIIGHYKGTIYQVSYRIIADTYWRTRFFEINYRQKDQLYVIAMEADGDGNWSEQGKANELYKGCIDIDIPLTPLTNSLPINRLKLHATEESDISVIYIDLLANEIKPVQQKYRRLSPFEYHYENIPNDFEADIRVDEDGFVTDYPQLFKRTMSIQF